MQSEKLTLLLKKGDTIALKQIYDLHAAQIFTIGKKLLKNNQDIEELIQDVFCEFWSQREKINTSKGYKSLLFTIAKRRTIDRFRKKVDILNLEDLDETALISQNPEDQLFYKEASAYMESRIKDLPPKRQLIFNLRKKDGLTNKEIAEKLGISTTMVEKQMKLAYKYLREAYTHHLATMLCFFLIN